MYINQSLLQGNNLPVQSCNCAIPENIHTPCTEEIGISWWVGGSVRPKNLKKCMKLNWNFQRGGGLRKKPFHGEGMDIFWNYTLVKK